MDAKVDGILTYTANVLPGSQSVSESSVKYLDACKAVSNDYAQCCGVYTSFGTSDSDYGSHGVGQVHELFCNSYLIIIFQLISIFSWDMHLQV